MSRLAGLEGVVTIPVLIFTINGNKNIISNLVINALGTYAPEGIRCVEFETEGGLKAYLELHQIAAWEALRLEDAPHKKGFLKYTYHETADAGAKPVVLFSAQIGRDVQNESRVRGVASQILGDFSKNFLSRINAGQLPWGSPKKKRPDSRRSGSARFFGEPRLRRNKSRGLASDDVPLTQVASGW